jgi:hypothetical protein
MLTRSRWAALAARVLLAVSLAGLSGCGDEASSEAGGETDEPTHSTTTSEPSPAETSSPDERCPYLTADQVSDALGSPTQETAGTVNSCFFDPEGGDGPSVLLSRIDIQIDPMDYAAQSRALCQGEVTDLAAGDEAFSCVGALGPQGQLYVDRVLVTVAVSDAADEAAGLAAAEALLPMVTVPLTP